MKTRIQENTVWRYSWEMKVVMATMLVGLIFIFARTASAQVARPFGFPQPGLVNPLIVRPVGLPIAPRIINPFSPIVRPFPFVNPFIRQQLLLRQLLLRQALLNPFIDADDLGIGLGLGIGAGIGFGEDD